MLGGCASTQPSPQPQSSAPVPAQAAAPQASAASEVEASTQPIPAPNLVISPSLTIDTGSYAQRDDARALGDRLAQDFQLDPAWTRAALAQARFKDSVAKLIMPGPPSVAKNWAVYRSRFVEPMRIKAGVAFWRTYESDLRRAEARWGVPAAIIAGVIGVETIYGRNTGNFRVLDALATLSLDFPKGRSDRSSFFQKELGHFLKFCDEQKLAPTSVLGSYAGAMGLPQFMPSSVRSFGVDFDGDGRIDLLNSPVDAIGSVAHYLAEHGWQRNMPTYYDVTAPTDTEALAQLLVPDIVPSFTVADMQKRGATLPDAALDHTGLLALVKLENGDAAPTMIAGTGNFYAITRYNQSSYYALAVIQLGQAVARAASNTP
ncbi:MAG: lytic murein transglycosylase B [Burkholderiales bacterium]|nr:lytic murein transglycosylase B [Burkholderiales bacterium]